MQIYINGYPAGSTTNSKKLMNAIYDTKRNIGGCFDWCTAALRYDIAKNWRDQDTATFHKYIYITTYCNETYRSIDHRAKCGCGTHSAEDCFKSLASGKCVDEFMRNTVGSVLWPEFYQDSKQKTK